MKKLLMVLTLLSVILLSGCGFFNTIEAEVGFFGDEYLAECKLTGMPRPAAEDIRHDEKNVYCNMTKEERIKYAKDVAEYLIAKDDIYYKGYHYETGCVGGIFYLPEYRFAPLTSEADYGGWFAFSLTEELNEGDEYNYSYWNGVTVSVSMKEGTIGSYTYNTVIKIDKDPYGIAFYPPEHEHTGEWMMYNQSSHYYEYTCGCTLPDRIEKHVYNDMETFCSICGYDMSEEPPLVDETIYLRNLTGCEWLNEISSEDIAEIKIISGYVGVAPGNLNYISSSADEAVIARIFEEYYQLNTRPISKAEGQITGGSSITVKFILKNGTAKELYINNGNYRNPDDNYFKLLSTPKFEDTDNAKKAYGFISYMGTGTVYDGNENPICEIPTDELEFVELSADTGIGDVVMYIVKTEFGNLIFASNRVFYIEGSNDVCYELISDNLDALISEYKAAE